MCDEQRKKGARAVSAKQRGNEDICNSVNIKNKVKKREKKMKENNANDTSVTITNP